MKANFVISLFAVTAFLPAQTLPIPAAGNVTLSLDEYFKLTELARKPSRKVETPLLPYVLKSAQMNLQVDGESITGQILLDGEIFAKGDRKVPLVSGMIILDAQQQGRELPLEHEGLMHSGLFSGPGEFAVTLKTGLTLKIETGRAVITLPVPNAGTTRLSLTVPGDQTLVDLSPGLITKRTSSNGKTTIEATLIPGQSTNIFWAARLALQPKQAAPKEVRFLSDIKTLISISDAELGVTALAEITVIQGEPMQFTAQIPEGYELTGATGATLASSEVQQNAIILKVNNPAQRNHQFLLSMVKSNSAAKAEIPLVNFNGSQRETGEVLVEGNGAMELTATEKGGLRRMDMKEISPYLATLSRAGRHASFRYQKKAEAQAVALEWVRFPDSNVLSAVAQRAEVTTLVTSEGRSLTEVKLTLKNQAKPFLKVEFPPGSTILSSEVAGVKVKPVEGADGSRVPLLRAGFRPSGPYVISFVFP